MKKLTKQQKRTKQYKDYRKKKNILNKWQREQINKQKSALPMSKMPVNFPEKGKFIVKKNG